MTRDGRAMTEGAARERASQLCLGRFQERAHDILSSRMALRDDWATVGTTMQLVMSIADAGQARQVSLEQELPDEEVVAVAATRLRPLFLKDEEIYHQKVCNAILQQVASRGAPDTVALIRQLKRGWAALPSSHRFSAGAARHPRDPAPLLKDRQIAGDWLYGHLVHNDAERRDRIKALSPSMKLAAAVNWARDGIVATRATQQLIIDLERARLLAL